MFIEYKKNKPKSQTKTQMNLYFRYGIKLLTSIFFLAGFSMASFLNAEANPHKVEKAEQENQEKNKEQCLSCHQSLPEKPMENSGQHIIPDMKTMKKDAVAMCTDCHSDSGNSHVVGVTPEYSVPADLPLTGNKKIDCLTCHYVHGSLKSEIPMASVSAMDRLFSRERLRKSFLLRRNNSNGDLCLACHKKKE